MAKHLILVELPVTVDAKDQIAAMKACIDQFPAAQSIRVVKPPVK